MDQQDEHKNDENIQTANKTPDQSYINSTSGKNYPINTWIDFGKLISQIDRRISEIETDEKIAKDAKQK